MMKGLLNWTRGTEGRVGEGKKKIRGRGRVKEEGNGIYNKVGSSKVGGRSEGGMK